MNLHPTTEDYQEFMEDTGQSLERIIKTVDSLLSFASFHTIKTDESVEIGFLLEQAVQELSSKALDAGITLSVNRREAVTVEGNASLLYRTFYNIIENAIKYNHRGGAVNVTLSQRGNQADIEIEDNGNGMEEDVIAHIFEPFYRGDKSRSQSIPGSGLGLAVAGMILERHGGTIKVTSQKDIGSKFIVSFLLK